MKRFFVTGGTGFLGSHLVGKLLSLPDTTVRILSRGANRWATTTGVEVVYGDVLDAAVVERASREVDGIFHLAGFVSRDRRKAADLFDVHIQGTNNICESAIRNGSPRVVVVSSSGTIAASRVPVMHNENSPFTNEVAGGWPYYLSKIYQEKLALSFHETRGLPVVIVSPSLLLGPEDDRRSSTDDVLLFIRKKIPNIPAGGLNFIDVRDAAEMLVRAMESGVPGRRYLLGGHNMTVKEFFSMIERMSGVRGPKLELPETWSRGGAGILRGLYKIVGQNYPLDDVTVEMAYRFWYVDNSRAKAELGLNPRPAEETLKDTIAYLKRL
jgi:dihydroflavonol-4-reductase